jgi:hypothetical protein
MAQEFKPADRVSKDMSALLAKVVSSPISVGLRPSLVAAAVLAVLRRIKGIVPPWPVALQVCFGRGAISVADMGGAMYA